MLNFSVPASQITTASYFLLSDNCDQRKSISQSPAVSGTFVTNGSSGCGDNAVAYEIRLDRSSLLGRPARMIGFTVA